MIVGNMLLTGPATMRPEEMMKMVGPRIHQTLLDIYTHIAHKPRKIIYATMIFTDPGDFRAACRAVRNRHQAQEGDNYMIN